MSPEIFPIACGLLLGSILGIRSTSEKLSSAAALTFFFGILATVISGEFRVSLAFLLIDVPTVALSSLSALVVTRRLRRVYRV
jgi:hypothetical protein